MPYIENSERLQYNDDVDVLVRKLDGQPVGHVNYVISRLIWKLFFKRESYTLGNNLIGVLECVGKEFYRRHLSKYEDKKIVENGDVDLSE